MTTYCLLTVILREFLLKPNCHKLRIDKPTRVTSLSATLLDIVISNKCKTILHSYVVPCPIADHDLITSTVNVHKPKHKPSMTKTARQLANYYPNYLCNLMSNECNNLIQIFNTDDANPFAPTLQKANMLVYGAPLSNVLS